MSAHQCAEADREFIQFYHRRVAWLALGRHDKAIHDADHTLALMDFVRRHGIGRRLHRIARAVPRYRPVPSHRGRHRAGTRTASARRGHRRPARWDRAVDARISAPGGRSTTRPSRPTPRWSSSSARSSRRSARNSPSKRRLREQLDEAVAREDYEQAARLRDQIQAQTRARR